MSKVSFKGVLLGAITDTVSSAVLGIPLVVYVMLTLDRAHTPKDQLHAALIAAIHANTSFYDLQVLIGLACSALGGYVAAWLAKHDELLNGALSSFLCIAIGAYSIASGKESHPLLEGLLLFVATPVFAWLGGYLRLAQVRRRVNGDP